MHLSEVPSFTGYLPLLDYSVSLEATGMYGPAHNLDRGTCPGTNGSTLTVKKAVTYTHLIQ